MRAFISLLLVLGVAGCGLFGQKEGSRAGTEGQLPYKAKLSAGEDKRDVQISVSAGPASVDAVRESVRFEATKYCLFKYGSSDADWAIDPATNDWAFSRSGDTLTFSARCAAR
ncbi:MAG: hypothetical protein HKP40_11105 [Litoreibacter sp.]|nr:hypothetical protein [Litoreibacter sp.]